MKKNIFSKSILFEFDQSEFSKILKCELLFYEDTNAEPDVKIYINKKLKMDTILNNPKIHFEFKNGYAFQFNAILITWNFSGDIPIIYIDLPEDNFNPLKALIKRFFSIQYTLLPQEAGQILHELVLVPLTYIFEDIAPVHCSSFISNNKSFFVGGTGGTGKTSTLIEIGSKKEVSFFADDITIISKDGFSYPNFAYPKIYAYNTIGNPKLEKLLLKNDGIVGKLQWVIKKRRNPSNVRRRISPNILYNIPKKDRYKLDTYIIISRGDFRDITYKNVDCEKMADVTLEIMKSEYWVINNHYQWHKYNSYLRNESPLFDLDTVFKNWKSVYLQIFSRSTNYIFEVPSTMENKKFKEKMEEIIMNEIL
ncbi:MAG: hypothetical protein AB3K77_09645 [Methanosarcinaceae archaeon]